jgi:hypothetical protein
MASEVDIDGAFENLCAVEASTSATIQPHVESTSAIISHLGEGSGDVLAVYQAAAEAREDFLRNASSWVQYAMDANVLAALNVKISGYFGEQPRTRVDLAARARVLTCVGRPFVRPTPL